MFKWRRDHLRELVGAIDGPKMVPVTLEEPPDKGDGAPRTMGVIEIELAAGRIQIKGPVDADSLRTVLELLGRRQLTRIARNIEAFRLIIGQRQDCAKAKADAGKKRMER